MSWQDIVNNSELVYASVPEDKGFQTWSLKKTTCNVNIYEIHPVEDIDRIVCSILNSHDGSLDESRVAIILGFNVVDNFDVYPKRYADNAELEVFRAIVKPVIEWGLVIKLERTFNLTELGYNALREGKKYKFYSGEKVLFENPNLISYELQFNQFYPFYTALGVFSEIISKKLIPYNQIKLSQVFDIEETELIKQHKLQSKEPYCIFESEPTIYFSFESCSVDIRLFQQGNDYYPIIFINNQISFEATELLNSPENLNQKKKKIEWGLYLKLIKDPNAILDYETIIPFEDLLEFDSLIKDSRLVWGDRRLFFLIANNSNANPWFAISNFCPIDVPKLYLNKYSVTFDWTSL